MNGKDNGHQQGQIVHVQSWVVIYDLETTVYIWLCPIVCPSLIQRGRADDGQISMYD